MARGGGREGKRRTIRVKGKVGGGEKGDLYLFGRVGEEEGGGGKGRNGTWD